MTRKITKKIWIDEEAGFADAVPTSEYVRSRNGCRLIDLLLNYRKSMISNPDLMWRRAWEVFAVQRLSDMLLDSCMAVPEVPENFAGVRLTKRLFGKLLTELCGDGVEDLYAMNDDAEGTLHAKLYRFAEEYGNNNGKVK